VKLDALQSPNAQESEAVLVLQASELALDGGAAAVEPLPFVALARDAKVALFCPAPYRHDRGTSSDPGRDQVSALAVANRSTTAPPPAMARVVAQGDDRSVGMMVDVALGGRRPGAPRP
jgi:hypothetical protein